MYVQQNKPLEDTFPDPPENYSGHAFRRTEPPKAEPPIAEEPPVSPPQDIPQATPVQNADHVPAPENKSPLATAEVFAHKRRSDDLLSRLLPRGIHRLLGGLGGLGDKEGGSLLELLLPLAIIYLTWDSEDELLPLLLLFIFL